MEDFITLSLWFDQISKERQKTYPSLHSCELSSVTGAIFPAIPPPLIHTGAVKLGLAQPDVDVIVDTTEPLRKSVAAPGVWLIGF